MVIEVIATSVEDALAAERGGADRIELVRDLARGGLTPDVDLVRAVLAAVRIPVRVMVRETESHEVAASGVIDDLSRQAGAIGRLAVDGLVAGFLRGGAVDVEVLSAVLAAAPGVPVTFHRAFEDVANPAEAIRVLAATGRVDRVLVSAVAPGLDLERIVSWQRLAGKALTFIAGTGPDVETARAAAEQPMIREIHTGRAVRVPSSVEAPVSAAAVAGFVATVRAARRRVMDEAGGHVLTSARAEYASLRSLAERAAAQVDDEAFFRPLGDDGNSIALLMKHVGGNLRSRWTDFLTADGEKPDRQRDLEFERQPADSRDRVLEIWNQGWRAVDATLEGLAPDDLGQDVVIRGERQSAARALMRSLAHTAGHVHQVVMLARHWQGRGWRTLSIARGQSEQFRQQMIDRQTGR